MPALGAFCEEVSLSQSAEMSAVEACGWKRYELKIAT